MCSGFDRAARDEQVTNRYGHLAFEAVTRPVRGCRLVLASVGAYEPHQDAGRPLAGELMGSPRAAARHFCEAAVNLAIAASRAVDPNRPHADSPTVFVADFRP
ncbi:hypothetical protein ACFU8W_47165 [Streptomyces sp. NPDC057565]|uniref:hypothetical protein n=1 Tax=Streptomyces sp. NPDC057565 TaxID=3346169 RepID=UPI0036C44C56